MSLDYILDMTQRTMSLLTASHECESKARKFYKLSFLEGGGCYGEWMYPESSRKFNMFCVTMTQQFFKLFTYNDVNSFIM